MGWILGRLEHVITGTPSTPWSSTCWHNLSTGYNFHFSQENWSSIQTSRVRLLPTSQGFPLAIYPLRFSNCLNSPRGVEEFPGPSHYMASKGGLGVLYLCVSWLTPKCPRLWGNRELVSSQSHIWKIKFCPDLKDHDKNVSLGASPLYPVLPTIIRRSNSASFLLFPSGQDFF